MLLLPPINDPIRNGLDAQVRHFPHLVTLATVTVAVGVVLEGVEITHDAIVWAKRKLRQRRENVILAELSSISPACETTDREAESPNDGAPRWVKRVLRIGLILVVIGVVGEWRYGAKLEDAHNDVHTYDIGKLTEAAQKAGDAEKSAQGAAKAASAAQTSADAVAKETTRIRGNLEEIGKNAEQISGALAEAQYFLASPELRDPEKLRKDLEAFKGKQALFGSYKNDGDGYFVCKALLSVAQSAGMIPVDQCGEQNATPLVFKGIPGLSTVFSFPLLTMPRC